MSVKICLVPDDMVIRAGLPNVFANLLVTKPFQCGDKAGHPGILYRKDRRPRRSFFRYGQQNMDMVWHDYIAIYRDIIIEIVQLIDISCHNRSIWQQLYFRTVQEAGPYTNITICGLLHWGISWF